MNGGSRQQMVFNSIIFFIYLPIVFLLYWLVFKETRARNIFVIIASYFFYGWWDCRFLVLIVFTTLCSFLSGIAIERSPDKTVRKALLIANIGINLGILATFKYFNFFVSNLQALLAPLGIHPDFVTINLILPVGISFYTFQALSYSIDVYRGKIRATKDAAAFFAFISFFPQLVAGPIERATNLLPQFQRKREFNYAQAADGSRQILWGLFKKMVVADNCAQIANLIFNNFTNYGGLTLWAGALMFTFQIYGDFSGYSDIAIGTSKLFGIRLMRNFNLPYFSRSTPEFWKRWHISLNTWFVDYVYIPLGGSRHGRAKTIRNVFAIFLLSGLWHGAEWTFVAWGAYNAVLFIPTSFFSHNKGKGELPQGVAPSFTDSIKMAFTFILVVIGWIIFRADNLTHASDYFHRMLTDFSYSPADGIRNATIAICVMLLIEWVQRKRNHPFDIADEGILRYRPVRWAAYYFMALVIMIFYGAHSDFIYFQF